MALLPSGFGSVGGYQISRSLRFNSADSAYLNRTPASATNRDTLTISLWHKRSALGSLEIICQQGADTNNSSSLIFNSSNQLEYNHVDSGSTTDQCITSAVFRDVGAWYHIVLAIDTTQATDTNRIKLYVNNVQQTLGTANYPAQNVDTDFNTTNGFRIGSQVSSTPFYLNGYLTEVNFIDGQALTPSSFGQTNASTGVWEPIAYTGTYGTNGFFLKFADNSGTTSTTLGKDSSGNGNDWTPNNFSVTAGVGNDSLVDTPTTYGSDTGAGGEVRGNYCTLNPLSTTAGTYTQGNLRYVGASAWRRSNSTISMSTGKWYWEVTLGNAPYTPRASNSVYNAFGFGLSTVFNSTTSASSVTDAVILSDSGYYKNFSGSWTDGGTAFSNGDTLAIAVDLDANTFTFYRNNTQITTGTIGGTAGRELVPIIISYNGSYGVMDCNFGQRPFAYTAPSGFKALCTQNLPTPTIGATSTTQAGKYFNPVLYTGNGSTQSITGVGFQPDFTWMKSRSNATANVLVDAVRGVGLYLLSDFTDAEAGGGTSFLTAFNTDGFSVNVSPNTGVNANGATYVAWNWKANGAGSSNTQGTITSTVSANTTSGFSIVTYTGTGANATVGHGLGVAPRMIIVKRRNSTGEWLTYTQMTGNTNFLELNATAASFASITAWNNTSPTSSVFSVGTATGCNASGSTYVAYCFAEVPGYSAFGSYTGNGSADGPFVYTGFRPRYVMIKRTDSTDSWVIEDSSRDPYNVDTKYLLADSSGAESTASPSELRDLLSNGFKIRSTNQNASGGTYIYAAFAESPFKYSLAR